MKRKTKWVFWGFLSLDYQAMADYLREMAARGWLLERAGEFVAKFRASEPQDLQFTVDVFPYEGRLVSKNNPQAQEYRQMCAESGWQFLTSRDYLQFFSAPGRENPTPLQTDAFLEDKNVRSKLWRPELISFVFVSLVLVGYPRLFNYRVLLYFTTVAIAFLFPLFACSQFARGVYVIFWWLKAKRYIARGETLPKPTLQSARWRAFLFNGPPFLFFISMCLAIVIDLYLMPATINLEGLLPYVFLYSSFGLLHYFIKRKSRSVDTGIIAVFVGGFIIWAASIGFAYAVYSLDLTARLENKHLPQDYPRLTYTELASQPTILIDSKFQPGLSPVVSRYYHYEETHRIPKPHQHVIISPGARREITFSIDYYDAVHPYLAQLIVQGISKHILKFKFPELGISVTPAAPEQLKLWQADEVYFTKLFQPGLLMRRYNRVIHLQGNIDFTAEQTRKAIIEKFW